MPVPDAGTLHALQAEMCAVGFATGTDLVEDIAWEAAWSQIEGDGMLGTNILTGTVAAERHIWPRGWLDYDLAFRYLQLDKTFVVSIISVTLVHDLGECDCGTDDVTACMLEYDKRRGVLEVRSSEASISAGCGCVTCNREAWVDVTYVAGRWNTPADIPAEVKLALATLAQDWKRLMATAGASAPDGFIDQWQSMDYNERRGLLGRTPIGPSPAANLAWGVIRRYRVMRMLGLRGRPSQGG